MSNLIVNLKYRLSYGIAQLWLIYVLKGSNYRLKQELLIEISIEGPSDPVYKWYRLGSNGRPRICTESCRLFQHWRGIYNNLLVSIYSKLNKSGLISSRVGSLFKRDKIE